MENLRQAQGDIRYGVRGYRILGTKSRIRSIYTRREISNSRLVSNITRVGAPTGGSPSSFCSAKTVGRGKGSPREHDIERSYQIYPFSHLTLFAILFYNQLI